MQKTINQTLLTDAINHVKELHDKWIRVHSHDPICKCKCDLGKAYRAIEKSLPMAAVPEMPHVRVEEWPF